MNEAHDESQAPPVPAGDDKSFLREGGYSHGPDIAGDENVQPAVSAPGIASGNFREDAPLGAPDIRWNWWAVGAAASGLLWWGILRLVG
jgi:hypothetical protein